MPSVSSILSFLGIVAVFHSAYSCLHYRNILNDLDLDEQMVAAGVAGGGVDGSGSDGGAGSHPNNTTLMIPPVDVIFEVLFGFCCLLLGELVSMGSLQSVVIGGTRSSSSSSSKHKPLIAPSYRTRDFDLYGNRSQYYIKTTKKSS